MARACPRHRRSKFLEQEAWVTAGMEACRADAAEMESWGVGATSGAGDIIYRLSWRGRGAELLGVVSGTGPGAGGGTRRCV